MKCNHVDEKQAYNEFTMIKVHDEALLVVDLKARSAVKTPHQLVAEPGRRCRDLQLAVEPGRGCRDQLAAEPGRRRRDQLAAEPETVGDPRSGSDPITMKTV